MGIVSHYCSETLTPVSLASHSGFLVAFQCLQAHAPGDRDNKEFSSDSKWATAFLSNGLGNCIQEQKVEVVRKKMFGFGCYSSRSLLGRGHLRKTSPLEQLAICHVKVGEKLPEAERIEPLLVCLLFSRHTVGSCRANDQPFHKPGLGCVERKFEIRSHVLSSFFFHLNSILKYLILRNY